VSLKYNVQIQYCNSSPAKPELKKKKNYPDYACIPLKGNNGP